MRAIVNDEGLILEAEPGFTDLLRTVHEDWEGPTLPPEVRTVALAARATREVLGPLAVRHPLMPDWDVTQPQAEELTDFVLSLGEGQKAASDPATQGFDLLRSNCARCHAIDAASLSPEPKAPPT